MSPEHSRSLFQEGDPWCNWYASDPARAGTSTLNDYQNALAEADCVLQLRDASGNISWITKKAGDSSIVPQFSLQGGSSFPRFVLRLKLMNKETKAHSIMTAVFPAFSDQGSPPNIDQQKMGLPVQVGQQLRLPDEAANKPFTFSNSLEDVVYRYRTIAEFLKDDKKHTGLTDNTKHIILAWQSHVMPVCINFNASPAGLDAAQKDAGKKFRDMRRAVNQVKVYIIPQSNKLSTALAYFFNMPTPTPPPYPHYNPQQDQSSKRMRRLHVSDVQNLWVDNGQGGIRLTDAGLHFVIRSQGWENRSPNTVPNHIRMTGGKPFIKSLALRGHGVKGQQGGPGSFAGYYANEREYEVFRIVALAREIQVATANTTRPFDGNYNFNLVPAGLTQRAESDSGKHFYIFINVRSTRKFGDYTAILPVPGTHVAIRVSENKVTAAGRKAQGRPVMTTDASGSAVSIRARDYGVVPYPSCSSEQPVGHGRTSPHVLGGSPTFGHARVSSLSSNRSLPTGHAMAPSISSIRSAHSAQSRAGSPCAQLQYASMSDVSQPGQQPEKRYRGIVIPRTGEAHDDFDIAIYVRIDDTGVGFGLQECCGYFAFGNSHLPHKQIEQAVHLSMYGQENFYGIPYNNWVKYLLLAHENQNEARKSGGNPHPKWNRRLDYGLNEKQQLAVKRAISQPIKGNLNSRLAVIQGPPGAGKTRVAAAIAIHSYGAKEPLLMSAGSNHAVNNMADTLFQALYPMRPLHQTWTDRDGKSIRTPITHQAERGIWGVYRLGKEADEHYAMFVDNLESQITGRITEATGNDEFDTNNHSYRQWHDNSNMLSEADYENVEAYIRFRSTTGRRLSLGDHILARIRKAQAERSQWVNDWSGARDEYLKIWQFLTVRIGANHLHRRFADFFDYDDTAKQLRGEQLSQQEHDLGKASVTAWRDLQSHYLQHALIVLVTAATAGRKTLRRFRAQRVLIDEAAQLTEGETLNPTIRNYSKLQKIILIGDQKQVQPVVMARDASEFYEEHGRSLFVRLQMNGFVPVTLT